MKIKSVIFAMLFVGLALFELGCGSSGSSSSSTTTTETTTSSSDNNASTALTTDALTVSTTVPSN